MGNIGRNDPCHCGSGKKYKKCCLPEEGRRSSNAGADEYSTGDDWGYELFGARFPEIAEKETRNITIMDGEHSSLPEGIYVFHEMYCRERNCDCRRVFFYVTSAPRHNVEAVVCYGWESTDFYRKWYKDDDPHMVAEIKGPSLNLGSPQSHHAPEILELVKDVLIKDRDYVERIKRHYNMFKSEIDKKAMENR